MTGALALLMCAMMAAGARAADRSYIVVLKDGADASAAAQRATQRDGAKVRFVYSSALRGYTAAILADRLTYVQADPDAVLAKIMLDARAYNVAQPATATWAICATRSMAATTAT